MTLSDGRRVVTFQIAAVAGTREAWLIVEPGALRRVIRGEAAALATRQRVDTRIAAPLAAGWVPVDRRSAGASGVPPAPVPPDLALQISSLLEALGRARPALEVGRPSRAPLFLFFPTISTHTPYSPTPPYQPDWQRVLTDRPYDAADLDRAFAHEVDWLNLGPSYADAVAYAYATLGGYLRARADRDFVMILIGDHQPPALVSGEGAPWDVPVDVIASRRPVLERLLARGFRAGLAPAHPVLGRMHAMLPVLLEAFGDPESSPAAAGPPFRHTRPPNWPIHTQVGRRPQRWRISVTSYSDEHRLEPAGAPAASPVPRRVGDPSPIKHVFYSSCGRI